MHTFDKDDLPQEVRATYRKRNPRRRKALFSRQRAGYYQRIISVAALVFCSAFIIWGGFHLFAQGANAYGITVDGEVVAVLTTQQDAQGVLDAYMEEKNQTQGCQVLCAQDVTVDAVSARGYTCVNPEEALGILEDSLDVIVHAFVLTVNGKEVAALASLEEAEKAVECAKNYYVREGEKIIEAEIEEEIAFTRSWRNPETLVLPQVAANTLLFGTPQLAAHEVLSKDETLWTICKQYDVCIEDINAANPGLTSQDLSLGSEVKLAQAEPLINVVVVKEVQKTGEIPFGVDTKNNSSMLRGTEKTVSEGKKGLEEITLKVTESNGVEISRERTSSTVLEAPVNKVVERGTKMVIASRGSGSGGSVGWPLIGQLTSHFGPRGRGYHTGLDINGNTGDPIVAAEGGKVIFASYSGGYGNIIKLDHGDGLQTWYAHLNKFGVSVGDQVARGQYIGDVGNTGRSTGSHLHFEVRINGTPYNPINYLR